MHLKSLGILFLVIAGLCAFGGLFQLGETSGEKALYDSIARQQAEHWKYEERFRDQGADFSYASKLADKYVEPPTSQSNALRELQHDRDMRKIYFFAPAGLLGILGLICCANRKA
jgi:hypothetical protein